jgi:hypothetical protein
MAGCEAVSVCSVFSLCSGWLTGWLCVPSVCSDEGQCLNNQHLSACQSSLNSLLKLAILVTIYVFCDEERNTYSKYSGIWRSYIMILIWPVCVFWPIQ